MFLLSQIISNRKGSKGERKCTIFSQSEEKYKVKKNINYSKMMLSYNNMMISQCIPF